MPIFMHAKIFAIILAIERYDWIIPVLYHGSVTPLKNVST